MLDIKDITNTIIQGNQMKRRCKDCRWSAWLFGTRLRICFIFLHTLTGVYRDKSVRYADSCQSYTRKWWKFWRAK